MRQLKKFEEASIRDLANKIFVGLVEDVKDPKRLGRVKARVPGIFNQNIPTEDIPWSSPYSDLAGKGFRLPQVGKLVNVLYPSNDLYDGYYVFCEKYNINLQNKLDALDEDKYKTFVALLFDHRNQIYADDDGLMIDWRLNNIRIQPSSINLNLKDNKQMITLGSENANQSAMLGDNFLEWLDKLVNTLLQPTSLVGNMGAPIVRPQIDALMNEYKAIRKTFLSNNVKLNDNDKITTIKDRDIETLNKTQDDIQINWQPISEFNPSLAEEIKENNEKEIIETAKNAGGTPDPNKLSDNDVNIIEDVREINEAKREEEKVKVDITNNGVVLSVNSTGATSSNELPEENIKESNNQTVIPTSSDPMRDDPLSYFWENLEMDAEKGTYKAPLNEEEEEETYAPIIGRGLTTNDNYGTYTEIPEDGTEIDPELGGTGVFLTKSSGDLNYTSYNLPNSCYFPLGSRRKTKIILHLTAGWGENPSAYPNPGGRTHNVFKGFNNGVSTGWCITGGHTPQGFIKERDGLAVQLYDETQYWSYHTGANVGWPDDISCSVEVQNFGPFFKSGNYYYIWAQPPSANAFNFTGTFNHLKGQGHITELNNDFRGTNLFHKFTDAQLITLRDWILKMANDLNIQIDTKVYSEAWCTGKANINGNNVISLAQNRQRHGVYLHVHYLKQGKWDMPPQPEFLDMMNSL